MKESSTTVSSLQKTVSLDPIAQPASSTAGERRSPTRRGSRGDRHRMSAAIIVNIVQASDLLLLLFCGWLARSILTALSALHADGPLFLATVTGSFVGAVCLFRAGAYRLISLRSLGTQLKLLPLPLLAGGGSMMVCLFLMRDDGLVFREWPFLWLFSSAVVLIASRLYLSRLLHGWIASGRLARRVAVIGAGDFSREFIERLRSEPHSYTVVGLYDDRLSRIPAEQDGVSVRGSVRDLLERSRQEQIDLIVIALPVYR
jgi:polysaccharide biosynthesis protein PslA